jgi:hypothetical protein
MDPVYADDYGKTPKKAKDQPVLWRHSYRGNPVQFRAWRLTPPFLLS